MTVRFLAGPAQSGKTARIIDTVAEACRKDPFGAPILLLTTDQSTYQLEQDLLRRGKLPGFTRVRVMSFSRLETLLRNEDPAAKKRPHLSVTHRRLLVSMIRRRLARETEAPLFRINGIDEALGLFVMELQQQVLTPEAIQRAAEQLQKRSENRPTTGHFLRKLDALARFAEEYRATVAKRFEDPADSLRRFADLAKASSMTKGATIYIDGFVDFTPLEERMILALAAAARECTLTLTLDPIYLEGTGKGTRRATLFKPVVESYERLRRLIEAQGQRCEPVEVIGGTLPPLAEQIHHGLFRREQQPVPADGLLRMVQTTAPQQEVETIVAMIAEQLDGGKYQPSDISIVVRDMTSYARPLSEELRRAAIPFHLDQAEPLSDHPVIVAVLQLLQAAAFFPNPGALVALGKTGILKIARAKVDLLEKYLDQRPRLQSEWEQTESWSFHSTVSFDRDDQKARAEPPKREQLRVRQAATFLHALVKPLHREFFSKEALRLDLLIDQLIEFLETKLSRRVARDESATIDAVRDILLQCKEIAGEDPMTPHEAMDLLRPALESLTLPRIPPTLGEVILGQADHTRLPHRRILFLLDFNEGAFPKIVANRSLFSDDERRDLHAVGCELKPDSEKLFQRELSHVYRVLTTPREQLIVSRSERTFQNSERSPSIFWKQLQELFSSPAIELISPPSVYTEAEMKAYGEGWGESYWPVIMGQVLPAAEEEIIPNLVIKKHLRLSASRLERFAACPYKHFVDYTLCPREFRREQLDNQLLGQLAHKVLEGFTEGYRNGLRGGPALSAYVDQLYEEQQKKIAQAAGMNSAADRMKIDALRKQIGALCQWMADQAEQLALEPAETEKAFDLELTPAGTPEEDKISIRGFIDRIDVVAASQGSTGPYAAVIDYKLSKPRFDVYDWMAGTSLQLGVYAVALELLGYTPLGVFLLRINNSQTGLMDADPKFTGIWIDDVKTGTHDMMDQVEGGCAKPSLAEIRTQQGMNWFITLSKQRIADYAEQLREGIITPYPVARGKKLACEYCDYKSLCRFGVTRTATRVPLDPEIESTLRRKKKPIPLDDFKKLVEGGRPV